MAIFDLITTLFEKIKNSSIIKTIFYMAVLSKKDIDNFMLLP